MPVRTGVSWLLPIEIRERAAFGPESIQEALADLTQSVGASEAAILSTCNRTEIYCGQENDNRDKVFAWLSEHSGLGPEELRTDAFAALLALHGIAGERRAYQ